MHVLKNETSPRYIRPQGITSYLLAVGNETQRVGPGDCVFIPSGQPHGLKNDGDETLRYFSAAAPAYDPGHLEKIWSLNSEAETA